MFRLHSYSSDSAHSTTETREAILNDRCSKIQSFPTVPDGFDINLDPETCNHPFLRECNRRQCCDCQKVLDSNNFKDRFLEEEKHIENIRLEDAKTATPNIQERYQGEKHQEHQEQRKEEQSEIKDNDFNNLNQTFSHSDLIHQCGVTIEWLIAFTNHHQCWDWPTWKVNRLIIKPATAHKRCRYSHLPEMKKYVGKADVFLSHCWGACFGDLVACAVRTGSIIWLDIFAVRQWPGRAADLCFEEVISKCQALVISVSIDEKLRIDFDDIEEPVHNLMDTVFYTYKQKGHYDLIKETISLCRLWCIVEIAGAVRQKVPIVLRYGSVRLYKDTKDRFYETAYGLQLIQFLIEHIPDIKDASCGSGTDRTMHLNKIEKQKGSFEEFNYQVQCAMISAHEATTFQCFAIEAAFCGDHTEMEQMMNNCIKSGDGSEMVTSIRICIMSRQEDIALKLLSIMTPEIVGDLSVSREGKFRRCIWLASNHNQINFLREFFASGYGITAHQCGGMYGETALSIAVAEEHVDVVHLLLENGASFESEMDFGDHWYDGKGKLEDLWNSLLKKKEMKKGVECTYESRESDVSGESSTVSEPVSATEIITEEKQQQTEFTKSESTLASLFLWWYTGNEMKVLAVLSKVLYSHHCDHQNQYNSSILQIKNVLDRATIEKAWRSRWFAKGNLTGTVDAFMKEEYESLLLNESFIDKWTNVSEEKLDSLPMWLLISLLILFDQVPRNVFRGTPKSFAYDHIGILFAERLLKRWHSGEIDLPFGFQLTVLIGMCHAENGEKQKNLLNVMKTNKSFLSYKKDHEVVFVGIHDIVKNHLERIELFGRFPERNNILERESTDEEIAFLKALG
jgi:uncharacterized protein (DUF924 family)